MEILKKNLQFVTGNSMTIGISSVPMEMEELLARPDLKVDLEEFCKSGAADVVVIMTLSCYSEGQPVKDIAVYSPNRIFREQISDALDNSANIDLSLNPVCSSIDDIIVHHQGNMTASGAKVVPILKLFLCGDITPDITSKEFVIEQSIAMATEGFSHFSGIVSSAEDENVKVGCVQNSNVKFDLNSPDSFSSVSQDNNGYSGDGATERFEMSSIDLLNSSDQTNIITKDESLSCGQTDITSNVFTNIGAISNKNVLENTISDEQCENTMHDEKYNNMTDLDCFNQNNGSSEELFNNVVEMNKLEEFPNAQNSSTELCNADDSKFATIDTSVVNQSMSPQQNDEMSGIIQENVGIVHNEGTITYINGTKVQDQGFEWMTELTAQNNSSGFLNPHVSDYQCDLDISQSATATNTEEKPFIKENAKEREPNATDFVMSDTSAASQYLSLENTHSVLDLSSNTQNILDSSSSTNSVLDYSSNTPCNRNDQETISLSNNLVTTKSINLNAEVDAMWNNDNLAELTESDLYDTVTSPENQKVHNNCLVSTSGRNSPFVNSRMDSPIDGMFIESNSRTISEPGYHFSVPPNSLKDYKFDGFDRNSILLNFDSAEIVERVHKKKASLGREIDFQRQKDEGELNASYSTQNSFRDGSNHLSKDSSLLNLEDGDIVSKMQEKRNSLIIDMSFEIDKTALLRNTEIATNMETNNPFLSDKCEPDIVSDGAKIKQFANVFNDLENCPSDRVHAVDKMDVITDFEIPNQDLNNTSLKSITGAENQNGSTDFLNPFDDFGNISSISFEVTHNIDNNTDVANSFNDFDSMCCLSSNNENKQDNNDYSNPFKEHNIMSPFRIDTTNDMEGNVNVNSSFSCFDVSPVTVDSTDFANPFKCINNMSSSGDNVIANVVDNSVDNVVNNAVVNVMDNAVDDVDISVDTVMDNATDIDEYLAMVKENKDFVNPYEIRKYLPTGNIDLVDNSATVKGNTNPFKDLDKVFTTTSENVENNIDFLALFKDVENMSTVTDDTVNNEENAPFRNPYQDAVNMTSTKGEVKENVKSDVNLTDLFENIQRMSEDQIDAANKMEQSTIREYSDNILVQLDNESLTQSKKSPSQSINTLTNSDVYNQDSEHQECKEQDIYYQFKEEIHSLENRNGFQDLVNFSDTDLNSAIKSEDQSIEQECLHVLHDGVEEHATNEKNCYDIETNVSENVHKNGDNFDNRQKQYENQLVDKETSSANIENTSPDEEPIANGENTSLDEKLTANVENVIPEEELTENVENTSPIYVTVSKESAATADVDEEICLKLDVAESMSKAITKDIIENAIESFPDLTHPILAETFANEILNKEMTPTLDDPVELEIMNLTDEGLGNAHMSMSDFRQQVDNNNKMLRHEFAIETDYLPRMDPLRGCLNIATSSSSNTQIIETDADKEVVEGESFRKYTVEEDNITPSYFQSRPQLLDPGSNSQKTRETLIIENMITSANTVDVVDNATDIVGIDKDKDNDENVDNGHGLQEQAGTHSIGADHSCLDVEEENNNGIVTAAYLNETETRTYSERNTINNQREIHEYTTELSGDDNAITYDGVNSQNIHLNNAGQILISDQLEKIGVECVNLIHDADAMVGTCEKSCEIEKNVMETLDQNIQKEDIQCVSIDKIKKTSNNMSEQNVQENDAPISKDNFFDSSFDAPLYTSENNTEKYSNIFVKEINDGNVQNDAEEGNKCVYSEDMQIRMLNINMENNSESILDVTGEGASQSALLIPGHSVKPKELALEMLDQPGTLQNQDEPNLFHFLHSDNISKEEVLQSDINFPEKLSSSIFKEIEEKPHSSSSEMYDFWERDSQHTNLQEDQNNKALAEHNEEHLPNSFDDLLFLEQEVPKVSEVNSLDKVSFSDVIIEKDSEFLSQIDALKQDEMYSFGNYNDKVTLESTIPIISDSNTAETKSSVVVERLEETVAENKHEMFVNTISPDDQFRCISEVISEKTHNIIIEDDGEAQAVVQSNFQNSFNKIELEKEETGTSCCDIMEANSLRLIEVLKQEAEQSSFDINVGSDMPGKHLTVSHAIMEKATEAKVPANLKEQCVSNRYENYIDTANPDKVLSFTSDIGMNGKCLPDMVEKLEENVAASSFEKHVNSMIPEEPFLCVSDEINVKDHILMSQIESPDQNSMPIFGNYINTIITEGALPVMCNNGNAETNAYEMVEIPKETAVQNSVELVFDRAILQNALVGVTDVLSEKGQDNMAEADSQSQDVLNNFENCYAISNVPENANLIVQTNSSSLVENLEENVMQTSIDTPANRVIPEIPFFNMSENVMQQDTQGIAKVLVQQETQNVKNSFDIPDETIILEDPLLYKLDIISETSVQLQDQIPNITSTHCKTANMEHVLIPDINYTAIVEEHEEKPTPSSVEIHFDTVSQEKDLTISACTLHIDAQNMVLTELKEQHILGNLEQLAETVCLETIAPSKSEVNIIEKNSSNVIEEFEIKFGETSSFDMNASSIMQAEPTLNNIADKDTESRAQVDQYEPNLFHFLHSDNISKEEVLQSDINFPEKLSSSIFKEIEEKPHSSSSEMYDFWERDSQHTNLQEDQNNKALAEHNEEHLPNSFDDLLFLEQEVPKVSEVNSLDKVSFSDVIIEKDSEFLSQIDALKQDEMYSFGNYNDKVTLESTIPIISDSNTAETKSSVVVERLEETVAENKHEMFVNTISPDDQFRCISEVISEKTHNIIIEDDGEAQAVVQSNFQNSFNKIELEKEETGTSCCDIMEANSLRLIEVLKQEAEQSSFDINVGSDMPGKHLTVSHAIMEKATEAKVPANLKEQCVSNRYENYIDTANPDKVLSFTSDIGMNGKCLPDMVEKLEENVAASSFEKHVNSMIPEEPFLCVSDEINVKDHILMSQIESPDQNSMPIFGNYINTIITEGALPVMCNNGNAETNAYEMVEIPKETAVQNSVELVFDRAILQNALVGVTDVLSEKGQDNMAEADSQSQDVLNNFENCYAISNVPENANLIVQTNSSSLVENLEENVMQTSIDTPANRVIPEIPFFNMSENVMQQDTQGIAKVLVQQETQNVKNSFDIPDETIILEDPLLYKLDIISETSVQLQDQIPNITSTHCKTVNMEHVLIPDINYTAIVEEHEEKPTPSSVEIHFDTVSQEKDLTISACTLHIDAQNMVLTELKEQHILGNLEQLAETVCLETIAPSKSEVNIIEKNSSNVIEEFEIKFGETSSFDMNASSIMQAEPTLNNIADKDTESRAQVDQYEPNLFHFLHSDNIPKEEVLQSDINFPEKLSSSIFKEIEEKPHSSSSEMYDFWERDSQHTNLQEDQNNKALAEHNEEHLPNSFDDLLFLEQEVPKVSEVNSLDKVSFSDVIIEKDSEFLSQIDALKQDEMYSFGNYNDKVTLESTIPIISDSNTAETKSSVVVERLEETVAENKHEMFVNTISPDDQFRCISEVISEKTHNIIIEDDGEAQAVVQSNFQNSFNKIELEKEETGTSCCDIMEANSLRLIEVLKQEAEQSSFDINVGSDMPGKHLTVSHAIMEKATEAKVPANLKEQCVSNRYENYIDTANPDKVLSFTSDIGMNGKCLPDMVEKLEENVAASSFEKHVNSMIPEEPFLCVSDEINVKDHILMSQIESPDQNSMPIFGNYINTIITEGALPVMCNNGNAETNAYEMVEIPKETAVQNSVELVFDRAILQNALVGVTDVLSEKGQDNMAEADSQSQDVLNNFENCYAISNVPENANLIVQTNSSSLVENLEENVMQTSIDTPANRVIPEIPFFNMSENVMQQDTQGIAKVLVQQETQNVKNSFDIPDETIILEDPLLYKLDIISETSVQLQDQIPNITSTHCKTVNMEHVLIPDINYTAIVEEHEEKPTPSSVEIHFDTVSQEKDLTISACTLHIDAQNMVLTELKEQHILGNLEQLAETVCLETIAPSKSEVNIIEKNSSNVIEEFEIKFGETSSFDMNASSIMQAEPTLNNIADKDTESRAQVDQYEPNLFHFLHSDNIPKEEVLQSDINFPEKLSSSIFKEIEEKPHSSSSEMYFDTDFLERDSQHTNLQEDQNNKALAEHNEEHLPNSFDNLKDLLFLEQEVPKVSEVNSLDKVSFSDVIIEKDSEFLSQIDALKQDEMYSFGNYNDKVTLESTIPIISDRNTAETKSSVVVERLEETVAENKHEMFVSTYVQTKPVQDISQNSNDKNVLAKEKLNASCNIMESSSPSLIEVLQPKAEQSSFETDFWNKEFSNGNLQEDQNDVVIIESKGEHLPDMFDFLQVVVSLEKIAPTMSDVNVLCKHSSTVTKETKVETFTSNLCGDINDDILLENETDVDQQNYMTIGELEKCADAGSVLGNKQYNVDNIISPNILSSCSESETELIMVKANIGDIEAASPLEDFTETMEQKLNLEEHIYSHEENKDDIFGKDAHVIRQSMPNITYAEFNLSTIIPSFVVDSSLTESSVSTDSLSPVETVMGEQVCGFYEVNSDNVVDTSVADCDNANYKASSENILTIDSISPNETFLDEHAIGLHEVNPELFVDSSKTDISSTNYKMNIGSIETIDNITPGETPEDEHTSGFYGVNPELFVESSETVISNSTYKMRIKSIEPIDSVTPMTEHANEVNSEMLLDSSVEGFNTCIDRNNFDEHAFGFHDFNAIFSMQKEFIVSNNSLSPVESPENENNGTKCDVATMNNENEIHENMEIVRIEEFGTLQTNVNFSVEKQEHADDSSRINEANMNVAEINKEMFCEKKSKTAPIVNVSPFEIYENINNMSEMYALSIDDVNINEVKKVNVSLESTKISPEITVEIVENANVYGTHDFDLVRCHEISDACDKLDNVDLQGTVQQNIYIDSAFPPINSPSEEVFDLECEINPAIHIAREMDKLDSGNEIHSSRHITVRFAQTETKNTIHKQFDTVADDLVIDAMTDAIDSLKKSVCNKSDEQLQVVADSLINTAIAEAYEMSKKFNSCVNEEEISSNILDTVNEIHSDDSSDSEASSTTTEGSYKIEQSVENCSLIVSPEQYSITDGINEVKSLDNDLISDNTTNFAFSEYDLSTNKHHLVDFTDISMKDSVSDTEKPVYSDGLPDFINDTSLCSEEHEGFVIKSNDIDRIESHLYMGGLPVDETKIGGKSISNNIATTKPCCAESSTVESQYSVTSDALCNTITNSEEKTNPDFTIKGIPHLEYDVKIPLNTEVNDTEMTAMILYESSNNLKEENVSDITFVAEKHYEMCTYQTQDVQLNSSVYTDVIMDVDVNDTVTTTVEEIVDSIAKDNANMVEKKVLKDDMDTLGATVKHVGGDTYVTSKDIVDTTAGPMSICTESIVETVITDADQVSVVQTQVYFHEELEPVDDDEDGEDFPPKEIVSNTVLEPPVIARPTISYETMKEMDDTQEWHEDPIPGMGVAQDGGSSDGASNADSDSEYVKPARPNSLFNDTNHKKKIFPQKNLLDSADEQTDGTDDIPTPDDMEGELEWEDDTPITPLSENKKLADYQDDERERYENSKFRKVTIAGKDHQVDMHVIEPYKKVLSHGGYYGDGLNAIILFCGCYLPDKGRSDYQYVMENLFLYVISTLELLVAEDYMIVYFHGATPRRQMPSLVWLKRCYQMIDRRLKKNLKALLMVHPTLMLKTVVMMTKLFISSKFTSKLRFVKTLKELGKIIPMEYIYVPDLVQHTEKMLQTDPNYLEKLEKEMEKQGRQLKKKSGKK